MSCLPRTHTDAAADQAVALAPPDPGVKDRVETGRGRILVLAIAGRLRDHVRSIVVLSLTLSAVAVVHTTGMLTFPVRFDDEGTYVSQAWSLLTDGTLSPYTYWYDHPPFGWIQLSAWFGATGALGRAENSVSAGREAMLVAHLVSSGLLYGLARRLRFARASSVLAVALYTLSPLSLSMHRMVFLDNLAMPWLIGAFLLACTPRHRLAAYVGSALCFSAAVLSKETFVLVLPALLYQVWQNTDPSNRDYAWAMFGSVLVLTGMLYPTYAALNGELFPSPDRVSLVSAAMFQLSRAGGDTAGTIANWLRLDPYLLIGGALATVTLVVDRRLRPYVLMAAIHAVVVMRPGYLPVPYAVAMLLPAALLLAGVVDRLAGMRLHARPVRRLPAAAAVLALIVAAVVAGPAWARGIRTATTYDQDAPLRAAQQWVTDHIALEPDTRLLVDNSIWLDLVRTPLPEHNVVWFYKLDLDPAGAGLDEDWRGFDYIVATEIVRDASADLSKISEALDNSVVMARFGRPDTVEVRRIHPDGVPDRSNSERQLLVDRYREFRDHP